MYNDVTENYIRTMKGNNSSVDWFGTITSVNGVTPFEGKLIVEGTGLLTKACSSSASVDVGTAYASELSISFKKKDDISKVYFPESVIELWSRLSYPQEIVVYGDLQDYTWGDVDTMLWGEFPGDSGTWNSLKGEKWNSLKGEKWNELKPDEPVTLHHDIPLGRFIVKESVYSKNNIKIVAYDNMIKLDKTIDVVPNGVTRSPYEWLVWICNACEVELGNTEDDILQFRNGCRYVSFYDVSQDIKRYREILSKLSAILCANAMIDRNGKLVLRNYYSGADWRYTISSQSPYEITPSERYSSDISRYKTNYSTVTAIQKYQGKVISASQDKVEKGLTLELGYNPFLQDTESAPYILDDMLNTALAHGFYPFKITKPYNPLHDLMDVVSIDGYDGSYITSMTLKLHGKMSISCGGENPALQELDTDRLQSVTTFSPGTTSVGGSMWMLYSSNANKKFVSSKTLVAELTATISDKSAARLQIAWTGTYELEESSVVRADVQVDGVSIYQIVDDEAAGSHTLSITTGCGVSTAGDHKIEIYLEQETKEWQGAIEETT